MATSSGNPRMPLAGSRSGSRSVSSRRAFSISALRYSRNRSIVPGRALAFLASATCSATMIIVSAETMTAAIGSSKLTGIGFPSCYRACSPDGYGPRWAPLAAGAGDADALALVGRVTEAVGEAGFELGEPVEALGGGVRDPGQDRADDLVFPPGDRLREAEQFGDVVVLGAPVVEGGQPVPD